MPVTSAAFLIGALSLSGIPPFAGFFSKDDILASVYSATGAHPLYWPFLLLAFAAAFMTAYYIFRAWFLAFSGDKIRDPTIEHPHEGPWVMQVPLVVLSGLAIFAGLFAFIPSFSHLFIGLGVGVPPSYTTTDKLISILSASLGVAGIGLAYLVWGNGRVLSVPEGSPIQPIRRLLLNRYYMKDAYDWVGATGMYGLARGADFVDRFVIDGTVRGFERTFAALSDKMRKLQTGVVSDYAAYVVVGVIGLIVLLLYVGPWITGALGGG
jgi:NADH-quinone oxidoreductase subunit L